MAEILTPDLCIIGAGSGGLSVAAGAVQMGASVVLIEKHRMGGDCLNYGCVPSKALLAAGKRHPTPSYEQAMAHVANTIDTIAPVDAVERFEGLGCTVIEAAARFTGPHEVDAGGKTIRARRFVIATGSHAFVPPIEGLESVPYFTNESLFANRERPDHLIIIGGGPIGLEMAQAHRRLGCQVTVVEAARAFGKDDPECAAIVLNRLRGEGIAIHEQTKVVSVSGQAGALAVHCDGAGGPVTLEGSHLLVAVGRKPCVEGLGLEQAGVGFTTKGITVDAGLKTSNKKIYAIGDVAGGPQFTHVAGYHAGLVIRSALFRLPAKVNASAIPWATYTDPELSHVGLTEEAAREAGHAVQVLRWPLAENDRAVAESVHEGLVKIVLGQKGRILGATIVGPHGADLLQPWILAISQGLKIGAFTGMIVPYPTLGEASKRAAGSYYVPSIFSPLVQRVVRLLARLG